MASLLDTIDTIIKEEVESGINESLPDLDPVFQYIKNTSMGVQRSGLGREGAIGGSGSNKWGFKKVWGNGLSGAFSYRSTGVGTTITFDGSSDPFTMYGAGSSWQSASEMPGPGFVVQSIFLKEGYGNFTFPSDLLLTDRFDSAIGSVIDELLKGTVKRVALGMQHAFWRPSTDGRVVVATSPASSEDPDTTATSAYTLTSGRIRSLYPGLTLDVYVTSISTANRKTTDTAPVIVASVDYLAKTFTLMAAASLNLVVSTSYIFAPHRVNSNTTYLGPSGIEDWTTNPTTLFGLTLATYPQFRSLKGTESSALSDTILNKYVGGMRDAYGSKIVDSLLTTEGVLLGYLDNIDGLGQYQRNAQVLKPQAGFSGFGYQYDGNSIEFMTSPAIPSGVLYGQKLGGGNIKRYVPPKTPKTGSNGQFGGEVEFFGPVVGASSIFMPVNAATTAAITNMVQAPFRCYHEFTPDVLQGIRITGLTESIQTG